jgi:hypothetical protein
MRVILTFLLLPALCWAQPFQFVQELDSIPVIVDGDTLGAAWVGGYTETCPRTIDLNGDGDLDLLVAWANGQIEYWENSGTPYQASFMIIDRYYLGIDFGFAAKLAIWDMDADGDMDLLVRGEYPTMVFENVGGPFNPQFEIFEDSLRDNEGNLIYGYAVDLADIDADGDEDLLVGQYNASGIKYYQNIGDSTQYYFFYTTSNFANLSPGYYSSPYFCDIDADGDLDLFIGTWGGEILFYRNIGTPQQCNFILVSDHWMGVDVGEQAIPEFCDLDADGDYDLLVGKKNDMDHTTPGDMHFYRNVGTPQIPQMVLENQMYLTLDFQDDSEVGIADINLDGKADILVHANYISWLKNIGTPTQPIFQLQSYNIAGAGFLASTACWGDLNGDGHEDMVVALGWSGNLAFWINNGDTLNPQFNYYSTMTIGQLAGGQQLADMDGDGDNDMIVHVTSFQFDQYLYYYENRGTPQNFNFVLTTPNYQGWAGHYGVLSMLDFDGDEDNDIVAIDSTDAMTYFENIGTPQAAVFAPPYSPFMIVDSLDDEQCDFCDVDQDGDMDAFFGSILGGIKFYRNVTGESPVHPDPKRPAPSYPRISILLNPGNSSLVARYSLPVAGPVSLKVYDIAGRLTGTLFYGFQLPGTYSFSWDAANKAAGVYLVRLEAGEKVEVSKAVVVK